MGSWCIRLCRGVLVRQILTSWNRFGFRAIQSTCKSILFVVLVCFVLIGYPSMLQFQCLVWHSMIGKDREVGSKGGTNQNCCRLVCLRVSGFSLHYSILLEIGNIFILQGFFGGDNPDCQKTEDVSSNPIWLQALNCMCHFSTEENF